MKKQIILTGLLILLFLGIKAQQADHYIFINAGGGLHSLSYNLPNGKQKGGGGFTFNGGYSYFFSPSWGLEIGLGVSSLRSVATLNYMTSTPAIDTDGDAYEFRTYYKNWKETQTAYLFDIPLGVRFQKSINEKLKWTAALGAKISLPLSCRYKVSGGGIATTGYYSQWNVELTDMPKHGFSTITDRFKGNASLNPSYAGYADLGALYKLSSNVDCYAGTYISYGFNSMAKASNKIVYQKDGVYNGVLNSEQADKVRTFSLGLQVGIRWNLGRKKVVEKVTAPAILVEETAVVVTEPKKIENTPVDSTTPVVLVVEADSTKAMDVVVPEKAPSDSLYARARAIAASIKIKFGFNSSKPLAAEEKKLKELSDIAKSTPKMKIVIIGHTCNIASKDVNDKVGMKRAQAIKEVLLHFGVPENQLQTESKAFEEPLVPNTSREKRMKNRRVELKID